jgi:hypothetical protein
VSSTTVWQRQQVIVSIEVRTPQRFADLEAAPWTPAGFEVVPLPASRERGQVPDDPAETLRMGWALFPLAAGNRTVELPAVRYMRNGVARRVFALPLLHLEVQDLPPYLPPTIPVGVVALDSAILGSPVLRTGAVADWRVRLSSDELPPWRLPAVLRQVRSDTVLKAFSAHSDRTMAPDLLGVHGEAVHQIPLKPLRSGLLDLPTLRVQYFDPHTGRLTVLTGARERHLVLGLWWRFLLGALALSGGYVLLQRAGRWWLARSRRRSQRREALALLSAAGTPKELREALMALGRSEGWPSNLSLATWLTNWQTRFVEAPGLADTLQQLSVGCYDSRRPVDCEALRDELLARITGSRRRRRPMRLFPTPAIRTDRHGPGGSTRALLSSRP